MSECKFPGCAGRTDGDYCYAHEAAIARGIPLRDVESGPYCVERATSGDSIVSGPYLTGYLTQTPQQAESLAVLLNLAFEAGRQQALENEIARLQ